MATRSLIASDNFDRANEDPIVGNWTDLNGSNSRIKIVSNLVSPTHSQMAVARWSAAGSWADDQYSSFVVGAFANLSSKIGAVARASGDLNAARDFYDYRITDNVPKVTALFKTLNGTETQLDTTTSVTWANGDRVEIEVEDVAGNVTVRGFKNGVQQVSVVDSTSPLISGRPGICGTNAGTVLTADDWEGGNLVASATGSGGLLARYRNRLIIGTD